LDWLAGSAEADPMPVAARRRQRAAAAAAKPADEALRQRLRGWRLELSRKLNVPSYVVLHDSTIDAICRVKPASVGELLEVPGIGERKAQRYGDAILRLVRQ
jgi:ATP-dependent DNA helicase RecQ